MRRSVVIAATSALVVLVIGVLLVVWRLDALVRSAIERYGSAATKVAVRVESVAVSPAGGAAALRGLTVGNPSGFTDVNIFSLDTVDVVVDVGTVFSNPMVIDEVVLRAPEVYFEANQAGESNVEAIRRNIEEYRKAGRTQPPGDTGPRPGEPSGDASAEPRRFLIRKLSMQQARVVIDASAIGGERMVMSLPDAEEFDIGGRNDGATGAELAAILTTILVRDVTITVAAAKVQQVIEKHVGGETGKTVGEGLGEAIKGVGKALNTIFGVRKPPSDTELPPTPTQ
jgi:hypothetical protein